MSTKEKEGSEKPFVRRPDHMLSVRVKGSEERGKCGVAWARDNGTFTIQLFPGTVLSWKDNLVITLFPIARLEAYVRAEGESR